MRVAVIDCGTNTIRLYVADADAAGRLTEVTRRLEYVRLGEGVDATGRFAPAALARTFAAVERFAAVLAATPVDRLRFLATSAARDVANREEFVAGVESRLGVVPEVISGDEEAELSFFGALSGGPVAAGPVLVTDVGGGSTEFILGWATGQIIAKASTPMGSVRLRERFLAGDPPTVPQVAAARAYVEHLIDESGVGLGNVGTWLGVAGTCTSLAAMNLGLTAYDRTRVHNSSVGVADLTSLADHLLGLPVAAVEREYPTLEPLRASVIAAGALICATVANRARHPMVVRETDILNGAAARLAA